MNICKIEGCDSNCFGKGYCNKHYKRLRKYGDPLKMKIELHGKDRTPIYYSWQDMKSRCYDPNNKSYHNYGGRGITVCDRWLHSFVNFYEDMGDKPFPRAQLDREKNNLGYSKDNCRWVTGTVNQQNKRSNVFTKETVKLARQLYEKEGVPVKKLLQIFKVRYSTLYCVLHYKTWRNIQ